MKYFGAAKLTADKSLSDQYNHTHVNYFICIFVIHMAQFVTSCKSCESVSNCFASKRIVRCFLNSLDVQ